MTSINTNLPALQAQNALEDAKAAQEKAMERLSTGKKINRAGDDAALRYVYYSGLRASHRYVGGSKTCRSMVRNGCAAHAQSC